MLGRKKFFMLMTSNEVDKIILTTDQTTLQQVDLQISFITGTIYVDWGDGVKEQLIENSHTHDYTTQGIYNIELTGQINKLEDNFGNGVDNNITFADLSKYGGLGAYGNIGLQNNLLTAIPAISNYVSILNLENNNIQGDLILNDKPNLEKINVKNSSNLGDIYLTDNTSLTKCYLNPTAIQTIFNVFNCPNLDTLGAPDGAIFLYNTAELEQVILNGIATQTVYVTQISGSTIENDLHLEDLRNCNFYVIKNNNLSQSNVDRIINEILTSAQTYNINDGTLQIHGTNAAPSTAGYNDIATLQGLGWTVTSN